MRGKTVVATSCLLLTFLLTLGARVFGPGDLYDKDQAKTIAASADVALNGNWTWPRDPIGEPSTKPPLYNWLDAMVLKLSPRWGEWAFKLPSMIAAGAIAWLCLIETRFMLRDDPRVTFVAPLAAAIWLANAPVMKMAYLSRPDMLLAALMTGAWYFATRVLDSIAPSGSSGLRVDESGATPDATPRSRVGLSRNALAFWLCVAGAALTKGPGALIPLVYVPLLAIVVHRRAGAIHRIGWTWGILLVLAIVGTWAALAYRRYPDAFFAILNEEAVKRFTTGGPEAIAKPVYLPALWFCSKFAPWSLFALAAIPLIGFRRLLRHELAPAVVWIALAIVAFSVAPGKRADYLLPAYPAASILAAYALVMLAERFRIPAAAMLLLPLLMSAYLVQWELRRSPEATSGQTRALVAFAREVDRIVPRDRPVVILVKGYHPMLAMLRRYDGNRARESDLTLGTWIIAPLDVSWPAHATSGVLPTVIQMGPKEIEPGKVALYRIGDEDVTRDAALKLLDDQYEWNFPPDRYRATRDRAAR